MDAELERMKSEISLADYAESVGFERDPRESTTAFIVLRRGEEKIVVTRDSTDGHDTYFSVRAAGDSGSIIDFVQRRGGGNLGQVRKELRPWLPGAKKPAPRRPAGEPRRPKPVTRDRAATLRRWNALERYSGRWLTDVRGIEPRLIEAAGVRQDERGNACIPHLVDGAVVGWETKNQGFSGFAANSERRLFGFRLDSEPLSCIVIGEASIDVMSYAQLHPVGGALYVSTCGSIGESQREQLTKLLARDVPVVIASDADQAGDQFAQALAAMAPPGADVRRARPPAPEGGKDWNDVLRARNAAQEAEERPAAPSARIWPSAGL